MRTIVDARFLVETSAKCHVCIDAKDRFDALLFAFLIELDGTVEIAIICEGHCVHAERFDVLDEIGNFGQCLKERVVAMCM